MMQCHNLDRIGLRHLDEFSYCCLHRTGRAAMPALKVPNLPTGLFMLIMSFALDTADLALVAAREMAATSEGEKS
jgi:hypothetical protein